MLLALLQNDKSSGIGLLRREIFPNALEFLSSVPT